MYRHIIPVVTLYYITSKSQQRGGGGVQLPNPGSLGDSGKYGMQKIMFPHLHNICLSKEK